MITHPLELGFGSPSTSGSTGCAIPYWVLMRISWLNDQDMISENLYPSSEFHPRKVFAQCLYEFLLYKWPGLVVEWLKWAQFLAAEKNLLQLL